MSLASNPTRRRALGDWIGHRLDRSSVRITDVQLLPGGAIQENWRISCLVDGAAGESRAFVLRRNAVATIGSSRPLAQEFAVLSRAHQAGVLVPTPIGYCDDPAVIGEYFSLVSAVEGVGSAPRIVKDTSLGGDRAALAARLGRELARIHAIRLPQPGWRFSGPARRPGTGRGRRAARGAGPVGLPPARPWSGGCAGRSCMRPTGGRRA